MVDTSNRNTGPGAILSFSLFGGLTTETVKTTFSEVIDPSTLITDVTMGELAAIDTSET